jgi:Asp-tRNA(Asn)/Glu-tRNA(Gln) amidotransferase A subunit family amidase
MTGQANFTPEEWELVTEAPPGAGLLVALSSRGGAFRESFSMGKAYLETREMHGASELLDAIVGTKPKLDRSHHGSYQEIEDYRLGRLRDAVSLLEGKATPDEVDDYRQFVVRLAEKVAHAHKEQGQEVSDAERAAIEKIREAVGAPAQPAA